MQLTLKNKLKLCWEIISMSNKHGYPAVEKRLSTFMRGYHAGLKDGLRGKLMEDLYEVKQ